MEFGVLGSGRRWGCAGDWRHVHVVGRRFRRQALSGAWRWPPPVSSPRALGGEDDPVPHVAEGKADLLLAVRVAARGVEEVDPRLHGAAQDRASACRSPRAESEAHRRPSGSREGPSLPKRILSIRSSITESPRWARRARRRVPEDPGRRRSSRRASRLSGGDRPEGQEGEGGDVAFTPRAAGVEAAGAPGTSSCRWASRGSVHV